MTRPFIVRADTIDLQDSNAPSAKDHSYNRGHQGSDSTAPHQANTLREVAHQVAEDESRSPRLSWASGNEQQGQDDLADGVKRRMQQQDDQNEQQQQQQLANAQNGGSGASSSDEGEDDGDLDDDMMDRISSSPSIDDEDIDFEFVYALHTFVATVEGQANATKGDTMVLLDDSNSYWWLVRIVKDSSIGYLPAEHIETPTERLARRNKYRNVDLSATMLSDNAPKQKQSFKGIRMRRKTVTFTEPTYVDYTEIDYSSDEEDIEELFGQNVVVQQQQAEQQQKQQAASQKLEEDEITEESAKVEPLKTRPDKESSIDSDKQDAIEEERRDSEEIVEGRVDGVRRTRNGTIRTTDSFFKDETVETKKISLTPNLLRDDTSSRPSTDSNGSKGRVSLESKMEKELVADKDKKGKKDKKPSAIRSFFSRKDKKRTTDDDDESFGKRSMDIISEPRDSEDPGVTEQHRQSPEKSSPGRSSSKLQKHQPRSDSALSRKDSTQAKPQGLASHLAEGRNNDVSYVPPASMRIIDPETRETKEISSSQIRQPEPSLDKPGPAPSSSLPRGPDPNAARPLQTVQAKSRMELDDSDSDEAEAILHSAEVTSELQPDKRSEEKLLRPQLPGAFPDSFQTVSTASSDQTVRPIEQDRERLSESPVHVSPVVSHNTQNPPDLMADNAQEASSPEDSPTPDFAIVDESSKERDQPQWDDAKLRAFFDEGEHVRDLLAVVYDTSDVDPSDSAASGLFREQNARLAEITTQLDNMLGDWLARKQRSRGTV